MQPLPTIPILFNQVRIHASKDDLDVIEQIAAVEASLKNLGYLPHRLMIQPTSDHWIDSLHHLQPPFIFNLVESEFGKGQEYHLIPSVLESHLFKYTGNSAEVLRITTNKVLTKEKLIAIGVPTPPWMTTQDYVHWSPHPLYIVKPIYEDASIGIHQDSIVGGESCISLRECIEKRNASTNMEFFAEKYISGREIGISMLGDSGNPVVLPAGEIRFLGYRDQGKFELLDYNAKWDEGSYEFQHSISAFEFDHKDQGLLHQLAELSIRCWKAFGLKGYARLDYRIDENGNPWLLEINANPCISPRESGFIAAAEQAGFSYTEVIRRIIAEA